jgi:hypothetical protein
MFGMLSRMFGNVKPMLGQHENILAKIRALTLLMFAALNVDAMVRSSLPHCCLFP